MKNNTSITIDLAKCISFHVDEKVLKPCVELPHKGYGITPTDYQQILTIRVDVRLVDGLADAYRILMGESHE